MGGEAPASPVETEQERLDAIMRCQRLDVTRAYHHVLKLTAAGEISMREYRRHVVKLAWSYVQAKGVVEALGLMASLTTDYLELEFPEDAALDTELLACGNDLADWLVQRGYVDEGVGDEPVLHPLVPARA